MSLATIWEDRRCGETFRILHSDRMHCCIFGVDFYSFFPECSNSDATTGSTQPGDLAILETHLNGMIADVAVGCGMNLIKEDPKPSLQ